MIEFVEAREVGIRFDSKPCRNACCVEPKVGRKVDARKNRY